MNEHHPGAVELLLFMEEEDLRHADHINGCPECSRLLARLRAERADFAITHPARALLRLDQAARPAASPRRRALAPVMAASLSLLLVLGMIMLGGGPGGQMRSKGSVGPLPDIKEMTDQALSAQSATTIGDIKLTVWVNRGAVGMLAGPSFVYQAGDELGFKAASAQYPYLTVVNEEGGALAVFKRSVDLNILGDAFYPLKLRITPGDTVLHLIFSRTPLPVEPITNKALADLNGDADGFRVLRLKINVGD